MVCIIMKKFYAKQHNRFSKIRQNVIMETNILAIWSVVVCPDCDQKFCHDKDLFGVFGDP